MTTTYQPGRYRFEQMQNHRFRFTVDLADVGPDGQISVGCKTFTLGNLRAANGSITYEASTGRATVSFVGDVDHVSVVRVPGYGPRLSLAEVSTYATAELIEDAAEWIVARPGIYRCTTHSDHGFVAQRMTGRSAHLSIVQITTGTLVPTSRASREGFHEWPECRPFISTPFDVFGENPARERKPVRVTRDQFSGVKRVAAP